MFKGSEGAADSVVTDPTWRGATNLLPLPIDAATARAFVTSPAERFTESQLDAMGSAIHANYVAFSVGKLPPNMRPWPKDSSTPGKNELGQTFRSANIDQARYTVDILEAAGFEVRRAADPANIVLFPAEDFAQRKSLTWPNWSTVGLLSSGWATAGAFVQ